VRGERRSDLPSRWRRLSLGCLPRAAPARSQGPVTRGQWLAGPSSIDRQFTSVISPWNPSANVPTAWRRAPAFGLSLPHRCFGRVVSIGVIVNPPDGGPAISDKQLALLQTFADQAVIANRNVRSLQGAGSCEPRTRRSESAQVRVSRHMSHDLRTPLNAIIGFLRS
jgi:signal transduction histidine kinase